MDSSNVTNLHVDPFRQLLQSIASDITNEDLASFKFLCESHIPKGRLEKIAGPLDLFSLLIEHNLIDNNRKDFLVSILNQIGRQDLSKRLINKRELHGSFGNNSDHSDRVNRDADTKETEVNVVTKVAGDVDRDATTKECEGVNREAATREPNECGGIVSRDATTVESDAPVDRESTTKEAPEVKQPTRIIFAYSTTSHDLLKGLPKLALQKNVNDPILFGRGKGIEDHGVFLNDETASRKHLQLKAVNVGDSEIEFFLDVVGKAIQINNKTIKSGSKLKLNNNDELKVGQLNFKIHIVPGNIVDVFGLEFARVREQQMANGPFCFSVPANGNPAIAIQAANLQNQAHLAPITQAPQFFQQQTQGPYLAGAPGVPGFYPIMTQGYAPPMAPPNLVHMPPGQSQPLVPSFQSQLVQGQFPEGSVPMGGAMLPQVSVPHGPFVLQQADQVEQKQTAQEKRNVYQATKKQPSEHIEDDQEILRAVTQSIEETHFPKCGQ